MVTVVMTTYKPTENAPRFQYAEECLVCLRLNLRCCETIDYHLADDGSPFIEELHALARRLGASFTTIKHNGIGASLNAAVAHMSSPWMYTTDDWALEGQLDLDMPLWLLSQGYDVVRLGPIHPNLRCITRHHAGMWWLDIDTAYGGFAFATRPFLAAPSLIAKVGLFDEGVNAYEAERLYAERCRDANVRIAAINLLGPWNHIGEYEVGHLPIERELFHVEKV